MPLNTTYRADRGHDSTQPPRTRTPLVMWAAAQPRSGKVGLTAGSDIT